MPDACFACERAATTREHVPPSCLFPERKDALDGRDHRRNLITVPSCEDHNAAKSADDWYLLWVLSANVMANAVGMRQALTKLGRAHKRRPALGESILQEATDVIVQDSRSGAEHEATEAPLDANRFDRVLTLVALGIYRHHFHTPWRGGVRVHADFIGEKDLSLKPRSDAARSAIFEAAAKVFSDQPRHGNNPEVFWYQVSPLAANDRCVMRLAFYGGCTATGLFTTSG